MGEQITWEVGFTRLRRFGYLVEKHHNKLEIRTSAISHPRKLTIKAGKVNERDIVKLEEARS